MFINRHKKEFKVLCMILFGLYIVLLVYFLFFAELLGRTDMNREYHYNLVLFKEIKRFIIYRRQLGMTAVLMNLVGNMVIFMPFGFLLPAMRRRMRRFWKVTLLSFEMSLAVELLQLVTKVGSCDVDDMLLNTIGGMLGYAVYAALQHNRDIRADRIRMQQTGQGQTERKDNKNGKQ